MDRLRFPALTHVWDVRPTHSIPPPPLLRDNNALIKYTCVLGKSTRRGRGKGAGKKKSQSAGAHIDMVQLGRPSTSGDKKQPVWDVEVWAGRDGKGRERERSASLFRGSGELGAKSRHM